MVVVKFSNVLKIPYDDMKCIQLTALKLPPTKSFRGEVAMVRLQQNNRFVFVIQDLSRSQKHARKANFNVDDRADK